MNVILSPTILEAEFQALQYGISDVHSIAYVVVDAGDLEGGLPPSDAKWSIIAGGDAILRDALTARYGSPVTLAELFSVSFPGVAIDPKKLNRPPVR